MNMNLPSFILLAASTLAGLAAAFAPLASDFEAARVFFWVSAISFGSLGLVWSVASKRYTLWVKLAVSSTIAAVAGAGLWWVLYDVRVKEAKQSTEERASTLRLASQAPTLVATGNSRINAAGSVFSGDAPFSFAKADDGSLIDMPGVKVTKTEGGFKVDVPKSREIRFPAPPPSLARLSNSDLKLEISRFCTTLLSLQKQFDNELFEPGGKYPPAERAEDVYRKFARIYRDDFAEQAFGLASAAFSKIGKVQSQGMPQGAEIGGSIVFNKMFVGPMPAKSAASFLEALADKLPN